VNASHRPPSGFARDRPTPEIPVSVIVPVFERADYLAETLESVARQTRAADEVIVVVDGSPVDVTAALDASGLRGVRVLHRPRGGPGAARNTGCAVATGAVLMFLDSDDVWLPTKLERQVAAFVGNAHLDVVFTSVEQFFSPELGRTGAPRSHEEADRLGRLPSTMAVRASSFRRVGGFREHTTFGELLDWYGRATDLGVRMTTIDEVLVRRRVHERNAGVRFRSARGDYATVAKELLDRRRAEGDQPVGSTASP
jgi:glycosyltransferase involved in cell wall biosynthesis